jgi:hypothetical protein
MEAPADLTSSASTDSSSSRSSSPGRGPSTSDPGDISDAATDDELIVGKAARAAIVRAFAYLQNKCLSILSSSLSANMMAAQVLEQLNVPYTVVVGYNEMPGIEACIPHVWLETKLAGETLITDMVWTNEGRLRAVVALNFVVRVVNEDEKDRAGMASYVRESKYPVLPAYAARGIPVPVLRANAADGFALYKANCPQFMRDIVPSMLAAALDITSKDVFVPASTPPPGATSGAGAAPGSGAGAAPLRR